MKNNSNEERQDEHIVDNKELNIWEALIPVVILMILLAINIQAYDGAWMGDYSNHYILLIAKRS